MIGRIRYVRKYFNFRSKLALLLFVLFTSTLLGVFGFMIIEGFNFLDALWYTIFTFTTVGYGVPENFSDNGKILTIILMTFGVGFVLYTLSVIAAEIMDGSLIKAIKERRMNAKIKLLKNHTIICGYGRNGQQSAKKLQHFNKDFLVIDKTYEELEPTNNMEIIFYKGDATQDETLISCGIEKAEALITALPSDADNLFVVLSARQLNPNLTIISRASSENSIAKLKTAGADNIIMPDKIGGDYMASLVVSPDIAEFINQINVAEKNQLNMMEVEAPKLNAYFEGISIEELKIHKITQCLLVGIKDTEGNYIINPDSKTKLTPNTFLIFLGRSEQIQKFNQNLESIEALS